MRARTLLLLFLAVVLAGGTALLARTWLAAERSKEIAEAAPVALATPSKSVLVARSDVRRGQILRPEELVWQIWPEGGLDKSYVVMGGPRTPESFAGWVAKNPIVGGEPISEAKIIKPGDRGFLAAVLRPGMRAISVPVTTTSGISGFIFPGDQVDLLLTFLVPSTPTPGDTTGKTYDHKAAETVLHNIRVIAIDQRLESKAGEAVPAHTATFEVSPKNSEVILLASEIGKVSLTLHSLVPGPDEMPNGELPGTATAGPSAPDSSTAAGATFTLDSEISPLLPKAAGSKDASESGTVTILRGSVKSSEAATSDASKVPAATPAPPKPGGS